MCFKAEELRSSLKQQIQNLPENFYDTFDYTKTGKNLTHPVTLGILCKILHSFSWVDKIGIDVRFNYGGHKKFQPDITIFDKIPELEQIKLFIDYESPNSSDDRIFEKNIEHYQRISTGNTSIPYVIITTLPDKKPNKTWKLYKADKKVLEKFDCKNEEIRKEKIRENPYKRWYQFYKNEGWLNYENIYFLNINGKEVKLIDKTSCF